ncbi:MAG TPA: glycosyltransferase family 4 protein [Chthoniobacteraceae bacterium]|nr:glycosyltransferase family 4 protein [Chthoniobacteraceae bacterium]
MRFLFLNQYFPPDPAPTGVLLRELGDELQRLGHQVEYVAARQSYRAGQGKRGRARRELAALGRMLIAGLRARRADVVISASSPPCLLVVAMLVALRHRALSVHWIMDLYPEIAVALGELRPGTLAAAIRRLMAWCYRKCEHVVVLDEDMADRVRVHGVEPTVIRPWVFASVLPQIPTTPMVPAVPWTWLYSGNLGRAHEWETLLEAQALLEQRGTQIRLLFQGGGPSRPQAEARARELGLRNVEWTGYVDEAELPTSLLRAEALVVSELRIVQGLLWPSKLGLILGLPRRIVWVGPTNGAVARLLREIPHAGLFEPGAALALADWLETRSQDSDRPIRAALDPATHRSESLAKWCELLAVRS